MSAPTIRGAGGAAGPWKADSNGETARPVSPAGARGRHATRALDGYRTAAAAHRDEQSMLEATYKSVNTGCLCTVCRYVPRHAA